MRVPRVNAAGADGTPRNTSPRQATQVSLGNVPIPKLNQTVPTGQTFLAARNQTPYKSVRGNSPDQHRLASAPHPEPSLSDGNVEQHEHNSEHKKHIENKEECECNCTTAADNIKLLMEEVETGGIQIEDL